jgi:hypothetical protein
LKEFDERSDSLYERRLHDIETDANDKIDVELNNRIMRDVNKHSNHAPGSARKEVPRELRGTPFPEI